MALPNKWTEQKRVQIIRYKISCRFKKDFWATVQQAGCFISMCVTPIAFSTTCPAGCFISMCVTPIAFSTACPLVHVVEKAIGVTHIEMKHPACCTAAQKSFLNLQDFCINHPSLGLASEDVKVFTCKHTEIGSKHWNQLYRRLPGCVVMGINRTRRLFGRQKKDAWAANQYTLYGFRPRCYHFLSPLFFVF